MAGVLLTPEQHIFVTERHLATLTTLRADGRPHVVPVAFTWDADAGLARVTSKRTSMKVRHIERAGEQGARVALCQVDGGRWLTLEGVAWVRDDHNSIADARARYARRYRELSDDPERVVVVISVDKVMSSSYMSRG